ncbi:cytidine deaminase [Coraliomargarita sp. SDUM461004]|uniref:Cytidine deaminase n=1 Tax=Thalassobacterium sedimentorum TaxID=3041258 RepID=A0ABU1AF82_9BACT|nr:cytidine deaminase [Coraliomargarita sp. SDUM461004]MDQ8193460.1 cytidine deaminase [Coraliomargarita sp. SDUM461004]
MALPDSTLDRVLADLDSATANYIRDAHQQLDFCGQLEGVTADLASKLLPLAAAYSVHPISGIAVGAIAVAASGKFYLGANLEFQGMPLHATLHAEQSAVLNAWMHNEHSISELVVSETPCGHCRQFLCELSNMDTLKLRIDHEIYSLKALLPQAFGPTRHKGHGLLDSPPIPLEAVKPQPLTSQQRAINAAQRSYAPYSRSPEGFILECLDGQIFSGRAAESAAFNPSVPGVLVALNQRNLSSSRHVAISTATEAKLATAINNPLPFASTLINSISNADIQVVQMDAR